MSAAAKVTCRTMAHVDQTKVGWCICREIPDHDTEHKCICGATWTDESAPSKGKWPDERPA